MTRDTAGWRCRRFLAFPQGHYVPLCSLAFLTLWLMTLIRTTSTTSAKKNMSPP